MGGNITRMLINLGVKRIVAMDLHAAQIQGFSTVAFDNLYAIRIHIENLKNTLFKGLSIEEINAKFVLVSPDVGGTKRVEAYANALEMSHVIMHKHRNYEKLGTILDTVLVGQSGDVTGKTAIIIDDMSDTMGTMVSAAKELQSHGIKDVILLVTHGIFSGPAFERINNCDLIIKVIVTNTLPQTVNMTKTDKLQIVDTSQTFAACITAIQTGTSISALFL